LKPPRQRLSPKSFVYPPVNKCDRPRHDAPADFAFRILNFFTGSASSEIAHPNSRRAARGDTRTHSADHDGPADSGSDHEARMCRRRACSGEGRKTCKRQRRERRFLHRAADLLQRFDVRPEEAP